jgi:hypothetical protein
MRRLDLNPDKIVTLTDFPVHHEQCLKIYFRIFERGLGRIVPPCPVIHKSTRIPFMKGRGLKAKTYNQALNSFLAKHPETEYFLLDGTHRTTAATLCHRKIPVMVFKTNNDISAARKRVARGELFSLTTGSTIKAAAKTLEEHFSETLVFQTVAEKTQRMVKEKAVPKYMINTYNREK